MTSVTFFLVTLTALLGLAVPAAANPTNADDFTATVIDNGNLAFQGQFPYQVSIRYNISKIGHICGGAILNHRWIVTSSYCSDYSTDVNTYKIVVGDIDVLKGDVYEVEKIVTEPVYRHKIAMWKTTTNITFSDRVNSIPVMPAKREGNMYPGEFLTITGWGSMMKSEIDGLLRHQQVKAVNHTECDKYYSEQQKELNHNCILREMGDCQGDLGAPLVKKGVLVAIVDKAYNCMIVKPERTFELSISRSFIRNNMADL